ncbi:MAG: RecX family transcriptional regulator [Myxococcota bacterium]
MKVPDVITAAYLQRVTAWYLERYGSSAGNLRRVLIQRVIRSAETERSEGERLVDAEIARLEAAGLVNDGLYAADKARSLRRRGSSARTVRAALRAKHLSDEAITHALDVATPASGADPEWEAARTWARKHRVGPWRRDPAAPDLDARRREMARMARAGFGFDLARRVVDAARIEDLDDDPPDR